MAIVTYPLNNIEYAAEDAELYNSTRTSGVFAMNDFDFSVTETDNYITIGAGMAWIKNARFAGKAVANKENVALELPLADAAFPRIDVVALQFDKTLNSTKMVVKSGTPASYPVIPSIVQTEMLYELYLYAVRREAGALVVFASDVTDLRPDEQYCGLMRDGVTRDSAVPDGSITTEKFAPNAKIPFAREADVALNGVQRLTGTKSGTVFSMTGLGGRTGIVPCTFAAPGAFVAGNTFNIDGEAYTVALQTGKAAENDLFVAGAVVSCIIDTEGKTVNFKSGGGGDVIIKMVSGTVSTTSNGTMSVTGTISGLAIKPIAVAIVGASNKYILGGLTIIGNNTLRNYAPIIGSSGYLAYNSGDFSATFNGNSITFTSDTTKASVTPSVTYHVFGY